ncbi:MAG: nicotinate-nucleotide adenylyltransferase [Planctomycetales bacterium]|nr:nicotinate-nucleotide adenylyltransferase [Planctomycetales bacterium]
MPTALMLGIFGGSFDPVHNGHLALARCCREQAQLEEVWLVPTATQPHKPGGPVASGRDRLAMLELALEGEAGLLACSLEIDRGGVSYTVDTLRAVAELRPVEQLFLLMGADTLADLPNWREPDAILQLARPLVVHRPGEATPDARHATIVEMPSIDVSSSQIRELLAHGEPIHGLTPVLVENYIQQNGLYRGA